MLRRVNLGENLLVCREARQRDIQASAGLRVLAHVQNDLSASSARLQLACGMAVSFIYSRLSAFTRVHSARELHVTASAQSKCLRVSSRPQQGAQHPFIGHYLSDGRLLSTLSHCLRHIISDDRLLDRFRLARIIRLLHGSRSK